MILKLKRTPGVFLVGFMGSGKSTVGRRLARELGWMFVDLDTDIENSTGMSISKIFEERGEPAFRQIEHEALLTRTREIKRGRPMVISLGGGAFVQTFNFSLVESSGISIWLDCPLEIIRERLSSNDSRPLARDTESLENLYRQRRNLYAKADYRVYVGSNDSDAVFRQILDLELF